MTHTSRRAGSALQHAAPRRRRRGLRTVATVTAVSLLAVLVVGVGLGAASMALLPGYLKIPTLEQASTIYARQNGRPVPIATFFAQNRVLATWDQVPASVKDAAVATEDPGFYREGGISIRGMLRGAVQTLLHHDTQGGSTITQQYVKNVRTQLCNEDYRVPPDAPPEVARKVHEQWVACNRDASGVTVTRKLQEVRYAMALEKRYTKRQILLGYLNIAFFGGNVYGIQAAAHYYFGTSAKNLTLPQAATLIAIVNNPNNLRVDESAAANPGNNAGNGYAAATARRNYVLSRMQDAGYITQDRYEAAAATKLTPHITPVRSGCMGADRYDAGFFCNFVQHEVLADPAFGANAQDRLATFQRGGLKIYSTLDLDLQKTAHDALAAYIPPTRSGMDLGGTQVAMRVGTGQIVSMVQNRRYNDTSTPPAGSTSINYATDIDRGGSAGFQTGSTFKAFVLAAWLEAGHTLSQSVDANNHYFPAGDFHSSCGGAWANWPVQNAETYEGGYMSVLNATAESVNTAYAQMGTQLDLCSISKIAQSLLVHSASPHVNPWRILPPMILGSNYVSPLTMATAYAAFANKGVVCTPVAIASVVGPHGKKLPAPQSQCTQAIPENIANTVAYALQSVMRYGTAATANPGDGVPILAKTGTTTHAYDNWLVTSTTQVASALWIGNVKGATNLRTTYFTPVDGPGPAYTGMNVKFPVDKPILQALNAKFGGAAFAAPDPALVSGAGRALPDDRPSVPPSAPATSTPTQTPPATPGATPSAPPSPSSPEGPADGQNPPGSGSTGAPGTGSGGTDSGGGTGSGGTAPSGSDPGGTGSGGSGPEGSVPPPGGSSGTGGQGGSGEAPGAGSGVQGGTLHGTPGSSGGRPAGSR